MNEGTHTSSSDQWFIKVDETLHGPFQSNEIIAKILNPDADLAKTISFSIKLETPIFNASTEEWKTAADLIPLFDLQKSTQKTSSAVHKKSSWSPPPRPSELKDTHIVGLNAERTNNIDYFALIGDKKIDHKKEPILKTNKSFHNQSSENKINPSSENHSTQKSSNDYSEQEEQTNFIELDWDSWSQWFKKHQFKLSIAAGAGFVFTGAYSALNLLTSQNRQPAATQKISQANQKKSTHETKNASGVKIQPSMGLSANGMLNGSRESYDSLGNGKNKIKKNTGSFTPSANPIPPRYSKVVSPTNSNGAPSTQNIYENQNDPALQQRSADTTQNPSSPDLQNSQNFQREEAQFYNSNANENAQTQPISTPTNDVQSLTPPQALVDPNSGFVTPPNLAPPMNSANDPQNTYMNQSPPTTPFGQTPNQAPNPAGSLDPNSANDPNRYPTADPNGGGPIGY